jgi:hypothetical protein
MECSIDPVQAPKVVVAFADLDKETSIQGVCELALEKLKKTEVKFISCQVDHDMSLVNTQRK